MQLLTQLLPKVAVLQATTVGFTGVTSLVEDKRPLYSHSAYLIDDVPRLSLDDHVLKRIRYVAVCCIFRCLVCERDDGTESSDHGVQLSAVRRVTQEQFLNSLSNTVFGGHPQAEVKGVVWAKVDANGGFARSVFQTGATGGDDQRVAMRGTTKDARVLSIAAKMDETAFVRIDGGTG